MPRSARKESGCGIYHVMMRGINRQAIFDDDEDCRRFMDILADLPFQHDDDGRLLPIPPYAVYNIGGGQPENLLDFVQILQEELVRAGVLPSDFDFEAHKGKRSF